MDLTSAYAGILRLQTSVFSTSDVTAKLKIRADHASKILERLAKRQLVFRLIRGKWAVDTVRDPFLLVDHLCSPMPAYISLQSALYFHGMISQIPRLTYAVSLGRSKKVITSLGGISIHHIDARFFFGFTEEGSQRIKMATPEKALLDVLYLRQSKIRLFVTLPELTFPKSFSLSRCKAMLQQIPSVQRRLIVKQGLSEVVKQRRRGKRRCNYSALSTVGS